MKKFLLLTLVAFATLSASAVERMKKAPIPREQKMALTTKSSFSGLVKRQGAYQLSNVHPAKNIKSVAKVEEAPIEFIPCYSDWTYHYTPIMGGFIFKIMHDGASYAVSDGMVYLKPFAELSSALEGTFADVDNSNSKYGADSITFNCDVVFAHYKDPNDETKISNLYLEPSTIVDDEEIGYYPVRSGEKTFGAYYFAEYGELYIPSSVTLALYEGDATDIFDEYFVARYLDLIPQEDYVSYMSKATVSAKSYWTTEEDNEDYDGDAKVFFGYKDETLSYMYVQGADSFNPKAWVEFDVDKKDATKFELSSDYYLGDVVYQDTTYLFTTCGFVYNEEEGLFYNGIQGQYGWEYPSYYKMTDNADETSTLKNTENTYYGTFYYKGSASDYNIYNAVELSINILYEPVDAIVDVKNSTKQSNAMYNLAGQRVDRNYKGIVIRNGKKVLVK